MNISKVAWLFIATLLAGACSKTPEPTTAPTPQALIEHGKEFNKEVVKVANGVYMAIGYGIANSILLEGSDGVIVVDTMESVESAQDVLAEFRKITDKPIKALVYTHSHPDHIGGASVFAGGADIPIYGHDTLAEQMDRTATELRPIITARSMRMYGAQLTPEQRPNLGVGPFIALRDGSSIGVLRPTRVFRDTLEDTVAGIRFQLVHAPGETPDQLFMWLPDRKILLPGDNVYKAFPNLYTIRGTGYRSPKLWANSIDKMRALNAELMVPSHTRALAGKAEIAAMLTDYRDAIRYVYDQSVRYLNQGLMPDEIAQRVRLPAHLAASPYLQEFYGKPSWSAKTVFDGALGWFDGDPAHLQPLAPDDEARRMVELAGGEATLNERIAAAAQAGDTQWALQLAGYALRANPENTAAREARVAALRRLGEDETNPPARNYYLMSAGQLSGEYKNVEEVVKPTPEMLRQMPLALYFDGMAVNLRAEKTLDTTIRVGFEFSDTGERYTYIVRRGASEVVPGIVADADLVTRVSAQAFKEMLARLRSPAVALARDFEMAKGSKLDFAKFMALFRPDEA